MSFAVFGLGVPGMKIEGRSASGNPSGSGRHEKLHEHSPDGVSLHREDIAGTPGGAAAVPFTDTDERIEPTHPSDFPDRREKGWPASALRSGP